MTSDDLVGWVVSALLTINGLLILILMAQVREVKATTAKIFDRLDRCVTEEDCSRHTKMCFDTCPVRQHQPVLIGGAAGQKP